MGTANLLGPGSRGVYIRHGLVGWGSLLACIEGFLGWSSALIVLRTVSCCDGVGASHVDIQDTQKPEG